MYCMNIHQHCRLHWLISVLLEIDEQGSEVRFAIAHVSIVPTEFVV